MKSIILNSGQEMPVLGLGTWQLNGPKCTEIVKEALEMGYRHIDTADAYENQQDIAPALRASGIDRNELFITSKVNRLDLHYDDFLKKTDKILNELEIEYLDLLLIHWPNKDIPIEETLKAMAELKVRGKVKNLGVSNFTESHLEKVLDLYPGLISVNQVEFHPYLYQKALLDYCQKNDIVLTAYSPLARGMVFEDNRIKELAEEYGHTPAQLVLKWLVEKGIVVIPKAGSTAHLKDNLEVLNMDLPASALELLDTFNENRRLIAPSFHEFW
ncbi:MAG: aldo/keto reductase [Halanaerobiaceae bacterium]|nr:aldo/keto reductase [Halanaerobiaceae bacterium]